MIILAYLALWSKPRAQPPGLPRALGAVPARASDRAAKFEPLPEARKGTNPSLELGFLHSSLDSSPVRASNGAIRGCARIEPRFEARGFAVHTTSAGRLQDMLSETEVRVAVGYNVERRAGLGGCISFLRIHTRATVAREPSPAAHRDFNTTLSIAVIRYYHRW